jgi:hypothetical protein
MLTALAGGALPALRAARRSGAGPDFLANARKSTGPENRCALIRDTITRLFHRENNWTVPGRHLE